MRRSRLNPISRKNSKRWADRALIESYMARKQRDELLPVLERCGFHVPQYRLPGRQEFEPHHIFGNMGQRWDLLSNVISVSHATHDWCHNHKFQAEWRVAALWVKLDESELSLSEFRTVTGRNLEGYLEMFPMEHPLLLEMSEVLMAFARKGV